MYFLFLKVVTTMFLPGVQKFEESLLIWEKSVVCCLKVLMLWLWLQPLPPTRASKYADVRHAIIISRSLNCPTIFYSVENKSKSFQEAFQSLVDKLKLKRTECDYNTIIYSKRYDDVTDINMFGLEML